MPARIGPKKPDRVYLRLWREAHDPPLTLEQLGLRISPPVSKSTVYRWEKAKPGKIPSGVVGAYAEALGRKLVDMYRRPGQGPSLDAMAELLDPESRKAVVNMIEALVRKAG